MCAIHHPYPLIKKKLALCHCERYLWERLNTIEKRLIELSMGHMVRSNLLPHLILKPNSTARNCQTPPLLWAAPYNHSFNTSKLSLNDWLAMIHWCALLFIPSVLSMCKHSVPTVAKKNRKNARSIIVFLSFKNTFSAISVIKQ